jgi:hypothetical protein
MRNSVAPIDSKQKSLKEASLRWFRFAMLGFALVLNAACSTPDVTYRDPDPQETAWYAYQQCMSSLPRGVNPSACDNVGATNAQSRYYYTGANTAMPGYYGSGGGYGSTYDPYGTGAYGGGYGGNYDPYGYGAPSYRGFKAESALTDPSSEDSQTMLDQSYRAYLQTLDAESLASLTEQWKQLSAAAAQ